MLQVTKMRMPQFPLNLVIVMPSNESRIDLAKRIAADHKGIMFLLVCGYFNRITV
jgi:hypothetical protein